MRPTPAAKRPGISRLSDLADRVTRATGASVVIQDWGAKAHVKQVFTDALRTATPEARKKFMTELEELGY